MTGSDPSVDQTSTEIPSVGPVEVSESPVRQALQGVPRSLRYEESWMHRGNVTHVVCSPTANSEYLLSGSDDGRVKLWRSTALAHAQKKNIGSVVGERTMMEAARQGVCLEFIRDYKAHENPISSLKMSADGTFAASIAAGERLVKVFNVTTFDLFAIRRLPFVPSCIEILSKRNPGDYWLIASDRDSNRIAGFGLIRDVEKNFDEQRATLDDDEGETLRATWGGQSHGKIIKDEEQVTTKDLIVPSNPTESIKRPAPETEGGLMLMGEAKRRKEEEEEQRKRHEAAESRIPEARLEWTFARHNGSVHTITSLPDLSLVVSADLSGGIEIWPLSLFDDEVKDGSVHLKWKSKMDTDLFDLLKQRTYARCLSANSAGGGFIAAVCGDHKIRVWSIRSGKLKATIDESIRSITMSQMEASGDQAWRKIDNFDFGRRVGVEKELMSNPEESPKGVKLNPKVHAFETCRFDETGELLIYPTLEGLKVMQWKTSKLLDIIGKGEQLRFLGFCLFQAPTLIGHGSKGRRGSTSSHPTKPVNPYALDQRRNMMLTCAMNKRRFFVFSHLEPSEDSFVVGSAESRDHLNEAPTKEEREIGMQRAREKLRLRFGSGFATIHTTKGDIRIELHMEETPKTVENFVMHSRKGYYNNLIFHRVIKGFMIQTGCPLGKGTGGESIWGGNFEDEIRDSLHHDRPYMVSMANAGPGTNGSQFFITTVPCTHLDGKHTIFGKVVEGHDVIHAIENVTTSREDRPYEDIKMMTIKIEE